MAKIKEIANLTVKDLYEQVEEMVKRENTEANYETTLKEIEVIYAFLPCNAKKQARLIVNRTWDRVYE